ncbi:xylulokinase [Szabonella alba]|uniref:Xylulokinase n=1 Tax=Szabonella alba TaxID=2804194 RepID=A0A8K0V8Q1_9RHOB|nr:FGGY family carbohydrate kinase [Szabonella alba]MBL4917408.1 hypothetical protein [Szabonella alba]
MTAPTWLGLDLGTSSLKAVLTDSAGQVLAEASAPYPTLRPAIGWSEQDPAEWCRALRDCIADLQASAPDALDRLAAIGFCSAAHLPVLLDDAGAVIRPAILWSDQRSSDEVAELQARHGDHIRRVTCNAPSCTWTLPQLMWVRRHEPEAISRVTMLLSSKDYLIWLLTGQMQMDLTSAVATLMHRGDLHCGPVTGAGSGDRSGAGWDHDLAALAGLPPQALPPVTAPSTIVGKTGGGRDLFGLPRGVPVVSGGLDSAAEITACAGRAEATPPILRIGSSAAILVPGPAAARPGLLCYPQAPGPGHFHQAGTNSGAVALQWARALWGGLSHAETDTEVAATPPGADGMLFHPYLQGERAPYWNPDMRGSFSGLHGGHGRGHFLRAVMEGVAYSLRDCIARLDLPLPPGRAMRLAGGVTRGSIWPQILSDVLNRPLELVDHGESALGAAFLAIAALQGDTALPQVTIRATFRPDPDRTAIHDAAFARYRNLAGQIDRSSRNAPQG